MLEPRKIIKSGISDLRHLVNRSILVRGAVPPQFFRLDLGLSFRIPSFELFEFVTSYFWGYDG